MWSSAPGVHLLHTFTFCVIRDGFAFFLVVKSAYFSSCSLPILSNQSAHSDITSTSRFSIYNYCLLAIFFVVAIIHCEPYKWLCTYQQFLKYSEQFVFHLQPRYFQSHLNPLSYHSVPQFELQKLSLPRNIHFQIFFKFNICSWLFWLKHILLFLIQAPV